MQLVYITCNGPKEAKKIARKLLEKRLIACANIVPKIDSLYWWNGKIEHSSEALLLGKTVKKNTSKIIEQTKKLHSYDVPCIEFIKISGQNKECEKWAKKVLK